MKPIKLHPTDTWANLEQIITRLNELSEMTVRHNRLHGLSPYDGTLPTVDTKGNRVKERHSKEFRHESPVLQADEIFIHESIPGCWHVEIGHYKTKEEAEAALKLLTDNTN